jgi:hypothetical protein
MAVAHLHQTPQTFWDMTMAELWTSFFAKFPPESVNTTMGFSEEDKDKLEEMNIKFLDRVKSNGI